MKLVTFSKGQEDRVGAVVGDQVADLAWTVELLKQGQIPKGSLSSEVFENAKQTVLRSDFPPQDMSRLLGFDLAWFTNLQEILNGMMATRSQTALPQGLVKPFSTVRLRPPIPRPGKITCVGLNYALHAREQGKEPPNRPVFFLKSNNTVNAPGGPIRLPVNSTQIDYEVEFAVVMGKRGSRISEDKVFDYIAGYMILNDVTARDMQYSDRQWFRGKSCDTFGPMGPWVVTRDEVPDPHNLAISLTLNGQTMQNGNTSDLIFKIPFLVSYLSQSLTWEPGDVLSTGTPHGVGHYRKPPVYLKAGDTVIATVERIGTLTNPVVEPS